MCCYSTYTFRNWQFGPAWSKDRSATTSMLAFQVRILLGVWMFVSCEWWVLYRYGPYIAPIPRPAESYQARTCVWSSATITLYTYEYVDEVWTKKTMGLKGWVEPIIVMLSVHRTSASFKSEEKVATQSSSRNGCFKPLNSKFRSKSLCKIEVVCVVVLWQHITEEETLL